MLITAQQLFEQHGHRTERVKLFDSDHELIVRGVPAHVLEKAPKESASDAFIFVNGVVDEKGARYWTDEQAATVAAQVAPDVLQLVVARIYALSMISAERQEEIKKNWPTLPVATSGE